MMRCSMMLSDAGRLPFSARANTATDDDVRPPTQHTGTITGTGTYHLAGTLVLLVGTNPDRHARHHGSPGSPGSPTSVGTDSANRGY